MRKLFALAFAMLIVVGYANPVLAMDWCALPKLIPSREADFEAIFPRVESETGCKLDSKDSAHKATWLCPDDPLTEPNDTVVITLLRMPGDGITLLIHTGGITNLNAIRICAPSRYAITQQFVPGNLVYRGTITNGPVGGALRLLSRGPELGSLIYSTPNSYSDLFGPTVTELFGGFKPVSYPSTRIRVAGKNIVDTPADEILSEMQNRGAVIRNRNTDSAEGYLWQLGPMTGLDGVDSIELMSFLNHIFTVTYTYNGLDSYKRYIPLLDAEYGSSKPFQNDGCTVRIWESGSASIHGRVCKGKAPELELFNDVTIDQWTAVDSHITKQQTERTKDQNSKPKPTIDPDNF